jgi:heparin binding hemagglutinin HbhA
VIETMPITLPTSADVRKVRGEARKTFDKQLDLVRTPVLAWIGFNDLAVQTLRELPEKLSYEQLRARADRASDSVRKAYDEWAERGEVRVERIRTQPQVARVLRSAEDLNKRAVKQVDTVVDELHDAGEDVLDRFSSETRSIGEKTAQRTQRVAREVAAEVSEGGSQLAEEIVEAGDEAAHDTRSATRKAANRAAPAKSGNARTNNTTR